MKMLKNRLRPILGLLSLAFIIYSLVPVLSGTEPDIIQKIGPFFSLAFVFGDLEWLDQTENMGGLTAEMYIGIGNHIAYWPQLPTSPTNDTDTVTLSGDFLLNPGKFFITVYATPGTAKLEPENQGDVDGQSFSQKGEFFYPGSQKNAIAFARKINNSHGCIIGKDPNTGEMIVVGTKSKPVSFKVSLSTGGAAADPRGVKINFWCDSYVPFCFYNGVLPINYPDPVPNVPLVTPSGDPLLTQTSEVLTT